MELLKIIDENGNFTGEIMEKEKAHNLNLLHWEVATIIINDKNQILLQKRSANKRFEPNKWALCAGHVDANEELETAALREIKEEIGLTVSPEDLHLIEKMKITKKDINSRITRFYYVICNKKEEEFTIQEEELSEVKWFDINEVIKMMKNNDNRLVFGEEGLYIFEKLKEKRAILQ